MTKSITIVKDILRVSIILGGSTIRGPYDFQTEEWITKVLRFILIYSAKSLSFGFQKIGKVYLTAHEEVLKER